ncbi:helix-turn-helix transcriptional regulator [Staphylococcus simiae]|uniref:PadR family transcriptional regulator n=1 Tax=Staphylococcus simiae TaxID=308354 RepID=UPI001A97CE83|nr:helix-turn-helix transcriptional regulator [Staphylococcus simiae]MBO1198155.1 helix-turn-helix transcriptional regulator [Staphylococcus simiae]MBO1200301.1 helix-turn-helix transcriptional regulator [Staphylococcus simiae]MBO1202535.1 helix-turn-helix transcriptional regulator [Staphylococcus simiae]MBO1210187.1 helix-turn-helix transcriptional regulator [Staphylococcus simiae]MBO1228679.1 helix-turn-helix transcriptional regulator [Staphylococcus simiae]
MKGNQVLTEAVFYILLSLQQPLHGYGIIQYVAELSNDRVKLAPGTLYGALNTLLNKQWIKLVKEEHIKSKKEYLITAQGMEALKNEMARLKELVTNGEMILMEEI